MCSALYRCRGWCVMWVCGWWVARLDEWMLCGFCPRGGACVVHSALAKLRRAERSEPIRAAEMYGLRDNVRTRISTYQEPERMPALAQ